VREQPLSLLKACGGVAGRQGTNESFLLDTAENAASIAYPPSIDLQSIESKIRGAKHEKDENYSFIGH
jgi:hypothetical protein